MIVSSLRLKNWMPYKGEHLLELGPKAYAIVARRRDDAESSNWAGKSSIPEAMKFALYGEHRHRYDDGWISRGEPSGEVELVLSTGHRILRTRDRRGGKVYLFEPGSAAKPSIQAEAEEAIVRLVGLSKVDFKATCFFEQKRMSKFVTMEPSERMKVVSAWFRLEPLENCEKRVQGMGSQLEDAARKIEGHRAALDQREKDIWRQDEKGQPLWTPEKIRESIVLMTDQVEVKRGAVARLEEDLQAAAQAVGAAAREDDYRRVVAEGKAARAEFDKRNLPVLRQEEQTAAKAKDAVSAACRELARDVQAKGEVAAGQFDGKCPVAGIECPAKEQINGQRAANRKAYEESKTALQAWREKLSAETERYDGCVAKVQEAERLQHRLEVLREQAKKLHTAISAAKTTSDNRDPATIRKLLENARDELAQASTDLERLRSWLEELGKIEETRKALAEKAKEIARHVGVYREGQAVFRAARRKVAEGALAQIEEDANDVLRECGTSLVIEARWAREGKGFATACDACGHPFPTSVKVKNCERCGAVRGPKIENKLEVQLSDVSGAAEDLGGAAFQLAASRWLRAERGAAWSSAVLDEPFGALDAAHRRGLAAHLGKMLGDAFDQAFVVAHHASVLDALPGRIEIVNDGRWSVPRVIA